MKRILISALLIALFAGSPLRAQEPSGRRAGQNSGALEPVVVVAFSGFARLKSDVELLGKAADYPDLAKSLDGLLMFATQGQGLAGLVDDKPWGAVAGFGDTGPRGLVFLPVSDLQKLLGALAGLVGEPEDVGDGVWKIQKDGSTPAVFAKEADGWAFLAQQPDHLRDLPQDPQALLQGMDESFDLAARLYVQNIPSVFRDLFIDKLQEAIDQDVSDDDGDDEDDDEDDEDAGKQILDQVARRHLKNLAALAKDLDQVTVGWSIDHDGPRIRLDLNVTAVEGSHLAAQFAETADRPSLAGGFLSSDAMLALDVNCPVSEADSAEAQVILAKLRRHLIEEIEDDEDLDDPQAKKTVERLVDQVLDVAEATIKQGQCNVGASLLGDGPYTLVAGLAVADGAKLDSVLRKLVEIGAGDDNFPQARLDVAEHDGLHFHSLIVPLDDDEDDAELRKFYGDPLEVTLAFGPERAYVAIGGHGVESLRSALDKSADRPSDKSALVHGRAALGKVLALAARQEPDDVQTSQVAELFKGIAEDGVHVYVKQLANGLQVRLESEKGLLKVLGALAKTSVPAL